MTKEEKRYMYYNLYHSLVNLYKLYDRSHTKQEEYYLKAIINVYEEILSKFDEEYGKRIDTIYARAIKYKK